MTATTAHVLRVTVTDDADVTFTVNCPHDHTTPQACSAWENSDIGCICDCPSCTAGVHDDCDQETIAEIGPKWCKATPTGGCWYVHALEEVGARDVLQIVGTLTAEWPVTLTGTSWDTPTTVTAANTDTATEPAATPLRVADAANIINTGELHELDRLLRRASELADKAELPAMARQLLAVQGHVPALFEASR